MSKQEIWCVVKFYNEENSNNVPKKLGKVICKCIEKSDITKYSMEINQKDLINLD